MMQQFSQPTYGYNLQQAVTQPQQILTPLALAAAAGSQASLFLQAAAAGPSAQPSDVYNAASQLQAAYRNPFGPTPQPNTIMVSSTNTSLMSAAIKPPTQHQYCKCYRDVIYIIPLCSFFLFLD